MWVENDITHFGPILDRVVAKLAKMMRKDVVYLIVASDLLTHWAKVSSVIFQFNVLYFSSKGDPNSHLTLPHLYSYQPPGFDLNGKPIYNLEYPVHPQSGLSRKIPLFLFPVGTGT
jgi:hypothetical protein